MRWWRASRTKAPMSRLAFVQGRTPCPLCVRRMEWSYNHTPRLSTQRVFHVRFMVISLRQAAAYG